MSPWTPQEDVDTNPTFAAYVAAGGATIPEADWTRYKADADRVIDDVTFGRAVVETDATILARITDATYRVADALYKADTAGVVSEKLGSYSVQYATPPTRKDAYKVARGALSCTGLTYAGISTGRRVDNWQNLDAAYDEAVE